MGWGSRQKENLDEWEKAIDKETDGYMIWSAQYNATVTPSSKRRQSASCSQEPMQTHRPHRWTMAGGVGNGSLGVSWGLVSCWFLVGGSRTHTIPMFTVGLRRNSLAFASADSTFERMHPDQNGIVIFDILAAEPSKAR